MNLIFIDACTNKDTSAYLLQSNFANSVLAGTPETATDYGSGVIVTGDTFHAYDLPDADEECSNGSSTIRLYRLEGVTVFIESGINDVLGIYPENTCMEDYFTGWDFGDVDYAVGMAEFGFDGYYDEANESDTNVRVWVSGYFFGDNNDAKSAGYARDAWYEVIVFPTYQDAQDWIDQQESDIYYLASGEADRPAYTIVK